jgi:hypothetical protein
MGLEWRRRTARKDGPFIADPVQQDPAPDKKSDIRSVKERYQAYKLATRKDVEEEGRFKEFDE